MVLYVICFMKLLTFFSLGTIY